MRTAIIIGTGEGREKWWKECKDSVSGCGYPVRLVCDSSLFELGVIKYALKMGYDEFFYMHDTCFIKDSALFKTMFETLKGQNCCVSNYPNMFGMYIGKYVSDDLKKVNIPQPKSKIEAVELEVTWTRDFVKSAKSVLCIQPPLRDGSNFVTKNGRLNMKLENDFMIKYKGTWHRSMIK